MAFSAQALAQALLQFPGRLLCEGNRHGLGQAKRSLTETVYDSADYQVGLAGSGRRLDEHGPVHALADAASCICITHSVSSYVAGC